MTEGPRYRHYGHPERLPAYRGLQAMRLLPGF